MNRRYQNDSYATFMGGRGGFFIGATAGALAASIFTLAMDMFGAGAGGPGLAVMSGAAVGGLAGTLIGALRARPGGRGRWTGHERRFNHGPHAGIEKRSGSWMAHG